MDYEKVFERLFATKGMKEQIIQIDDFYLDAMFCDKTLTYEKLVAFINKYKKELIECALNDNLLIDSILCENWIIDYTKKDLITKEYLENLIDKINNKEFDSKTITFYLYLMSIHNLFGNKYDKNTLREILSINLMSILSTPGLLARNSDTILKNDEKIELADKLLSWNKKCGKSILPYIFQLETLKEYITILMNSNYVKNNVDYQKKLLNLLGVCEHSIIVRDTDIIPSKEEVEQINNLFHTYDSINKDIIVNSIREDSFLLVHFVRDNDVNYQLIGNDIIDMSKKSNNSFDSNQSEFFISSYYQYAISVIEKQTGEKFNINNNKMRELLNDLIIHYNNAINYRPLDRLPVKKRETSYNLRSYIRETDGRLSCSIIPNNNEEPKTHLDRKIGLVIRPTRDAIISASLGYTSEKSFYDFKNDSVPCTKIFSELGMGKFVNETCVDASKCEVIGVLLLSDEKDIVERAEKIATSYNTKIIRLIKEDTNKQTIKH